MPSCKSNIYCSVYTHSETDKLNLHVYTCIICLYSYLVYNSVHTCMVDATDWALINVGQWRFWLIYASALFVVRLGISRRGYISAGSTLTNFVACKHFWPRPNIPYEVSISRSHLYVPGMCPYCVTVTLSRAIQNAWQPIAFRRSSCMHEPFTY